MGKYVRGGDNFEYEYFGEAALCELAYAADVGKCEIFPEICFVGAHDGEDLVFYLSGETDCIPIDNAEHPFDVFKDFFISTQKYFANAESSGMSDRLSLLKMMTEAETVYLSAQCYFTLKNHERQKLLEWINTYLSEEIQLTIAEIEDDAKLDRAEAALEAIATDETNGDEVPLLALAVLVGSMAEATPSFVVHDEDVAWETPLVVDGEVVGPNTEIGEFDTPVY